MEVIVNNTGNGTETFENVYHELRAKEKRIYSDDELRSLPFISPDHLYYEEWRHRRRSMRRLLRYCRLKPRPLRILDVGCGNGWLVARLSTGTDVSVTGIDVHREEIVQAQRVFSEIPNLKFRLAEFMEMPAVEKYDMVVFAASLQYFPSLAEVARQSFRLLDNEGEIHILDTPFYEQDDVSFASSRSEAHFIKVRVPHMTPFYFHHTWSDLSGYDYRVLWQPRPWKRLFRIRQNPFPWIRITKHE
jgi:ubiquinone/menaquinone biosynthesis C-methylase UbiE